MNSSYPVISFTASGRNQSRYEILQILFRIRVKIGVVQEERLEGHEGQVAGEEESLPVSGVLGKAQIGYKQSGIEFESVVGHQDVTGQRFQFQSVRIADEEAALPVVAEQIVLDQGRDGNSWRNDESQSMIVMELIVADVDLPERDGRFPAR